MPNQERKHHHYGWVKDKPDSRDHIYHGEKANPKPPKSGGGWEGYLQFIILTIVNAIKAFINLFKKKPPTPTPGPNTVNCAVETGGCVDMRSQDSPIEDQGDLGSCTANALSGALQFLEIKDGLQEQTGTLNFSRLFVYYNERVIEGDVNLDDGAQLRDGIKTLASQGACYETTWPYDTAAFAVTPPASAYTQGAQHEILQYATITTLADMKACLDAGFPFVFGFSVYASFESSEVESTGVVPMPDTTTEEYMGGHAVMCLGYCDEQQRFICRNSWGLDWGQSGYFTIPYAYLDPAQGLGLASDFWTLRRGMDMIAEPKLQNL